MHVQGPQSLIPRRTLRGVARVHGATLFTGASTTITIRRPDADLSGIFFQRMDLASRPLIPARHANLFPEPRRTVLQAAGTATRVETVEHVLSALAGLGITDAILEIDGAEVPVGDGSAKPFVDAILGAGLLDLDPLHSNGTDPTPIMIRVPAVFGDSSGNIEVFPTGVPGLELVYKLDYGTDSPIPAQEASLFLPPSRSNGEYSAQIAPARTFCLLAEAQAMRKMGLFAHLEPRDLLVIGEHGPIDNAFRFENEPARHKLLDLLGDLSLTGRPIWGRIVASKSGHSLNHSVAAALSGLP